MNISELELKAFEFYQEGNFQQTIKCHTQIIEINQNHAPSYCARGCAKDSLNDFEGAIEDYSQAIRINPNYVDAYSNRGVSKTSVKNYEGAIEDFTEAIRINSNHAQAFSGRGKVKNYLKDYNGAILDFTEAIRINQNNIGAYKGRGTAKYNSKDFDGAIDDLTQAIRINPNDAAAYSVRGAAKLALKNYKGAIEDCTESIKNNPKNEIAYLNRGSAKMSLNNNEEAIADYTRAIQINPNYAVAYSNRGLPKHSLKDYKGAIEDCNDAIRINPNLETAYFIRGYVKITLKDYEGAIEDFSQAIRINPKYSKAYSNRGIVKQVLKKYEEAILDYTEAISLDPKLDITFEYLADLYYDWKYEVEKSICCLRICTTIEPNSSKYLWRVASLYVEWQTKSRIEDEEFYNILGPYADDCEKFYIDDRAFDEKMKIAQGFYSRAFINSFKELRTDLNNDFNEYKMIILIRQSPHMFSTLYEQMFFFSDVRSFTDKSDCPLLHKINQTNLIENVVYDNVRVRCLCSSEKAAELYKMWADYVNHEGFALKVNIRKDWLIENEIYTSFIKYSSQREILIKCDSPEQVIQDGIFVKHDDHIIEKEWRMVKFGTFAPKKGEKIGWAYKNEEMGLGVDVEAAYMGIDISTEAKLEMIKLAKIMFFDLYQMGQGPHSTYIANRIEIN